MPCPTTVSVKPLQLGSSVSASFLAHTNPADVLSKNSGFQTFWPLINPLLFWYGNTMGCTSWHDTGDPEDKVTKDVHAGKGSVTE